MDETELSTFQLMQRVVDFLEAFGISYRVVGSLASMAYGEPRFTNDVDILAAVESKHVSSLCNAFPPPDNYVSEQAVCEAISRCTQFNIIHIPSGLKVDVIVPNMSEYARTELMRGKRLKSEGEFDAWFCSPEDSILNKLLYFREGGSDKHLRDIASILKIQGSAIDRNYLNKWVRTLNIQKEWAIVSKQLGIQE